jgi:pyruvate,water dikinase
MLAESTFETIKSRKESFEKVKSLVYPDDFSSYIGHYPKPNEVKTVKNEFAEQGKGLKGMPVCGGKVRARVRVLESVMEAHKLEKGDILVTRQTDPGWVLVFPLISGLIVERGGMLSHGAIVSREFGIPAIVGVHEASSKIPDGALVLLDADTGFIEIINE